MGEWVKTHFTPRRRDLVTFIEDVSRPHGSHERTIDLRTFLARAPASEPVIFASSNDHWLSALIAAGQEHILDARPLYDSHRALQIQESRLRAEQVVISTSSATGLRRLLHFLRSWNQRLKGKIRAQELRENTATKLSPISTGDANESFPRIRALLNADDFRIGQYLPPGALALMNDHTAIAREYALKAGRFLQACKENPTLPTLSHVPFRDCYEPPVPQHANQVSTRYVFLLGSVVEHITATLTDCELLLHDLSRRGADGWPLETFIARCRDFFQPLGFGTFDGRIPLIAREAIATERSFADIVLGEGLWVSLVTDYALQVYACSCLPAQYAGRVRVHLFDDSSLATYDTAFYRQWIEWLRGGPLDSAQVSVLEQASADTHTEWSRAPAVHLTQSIRDTVRTKVLRHHARISNYSADLLRGFHGSRIQQSQRGSIIAMRG